MEQLQSPQVERRTALGREDMQFLRLKEVLNKCGMSKTKLYDAMKKGEFPQVVKLGAKSSAWVKSEIDTWMAERIRASRASKN